LQSHSNLANNPKWLLTLNGRVSRFLSYICFWGMCNKTDFTKLFNKTGGIMRGWSISVVMSLALISMSGRAFGQSNSNSLGLISAPNNPPVGIGTELSFGPVPRSQNALQIHYDASLFPNPTMPAMIRLSEGDSTTMQYYGLLGLMDFPDNNYSSLSSGRDLILHEHQGGDIIITNYSTLDPAFAHGTAIRFATTPDSLHKPLGPPFYTDVERETINSNGNIGFDLPPDTGLFAGLGNPKDQLQLGGSALIPGLTFYGGNRWEGLPRPGGGIFPVDWRGIYFNHYEDHTTGVTSRFTPIGSSGIHFADAFGGLLQLNCWPPDSALPLSDSANGVSLQLTGSQGLAMWTNESATGGAEYHHLFDVWRPGFVISPVTRNYNGLFFHHTPVYIGMDTGGTLVNFTNLPNLDPDIGDDTTWMLVVNGAELAKEIYVLDSTWADYVFEPSYKLPSLNEVERFIKSNHHLEGIPAASKIAQTGVPIGRTEEALTKKVEELTLYLIDQNKKIERQNERIGELEASIQELTNRKGR
jgi:hypothetical protein